MDTSHAAAILLKSLEEIRQIACSDSPPQKRIDKISELAGSTVDRYNRLIEGNAKSSIRLDQASSD